MIQSVLSLSAYQERKTYSGSFLSAYRAFFLAVVVSSLLLAGCSISHTPQKRPRGTASYTVLGKTYYPLQSAKGFTQKGTASYYAEQFHGKKTASGERFNMHAMTCAHTILPFDTLLRVTNLDNNRTVTVRVNDRGPFRGDRIIDLSRAAATKLGFTGKGTTKVFIRALEDEDEPQTPQKKEPLYHIQVGAFAQKKNAEACSRMLAREGYPVRIIPLQKGLYAVQAGPLHEESANIALALIRIRFRDARLIAED